ncbi:MAG: hypothetical protein JWR87_1574 [Segetibacter sp.]|jgi:hypothetical protein|nr:hypothetical protein [Segetibacter sp.]
MQGLFLWSQPRKLMQLFLRRTRVRGGLCGAAVCPVLYRFNFKSTPHPRSFSYRRRMPRCNRFIPFDKANLKGLELTNFNQRTLNILLN